MRSRLTAAALILTVSAGCAADIVPSASPTASMTPSPSAPALTPAATTPQLRGDALAAAVDAEGARHHLEALQRIADEHGGRRATGTPGFDESVAYVADQLMRAGYAVDTQTFALPGGASSVNLLAERSGRRADGEIVMLGAHLDSVAAGPGINDNGSGVAALLVLADSLADLPAPERGVRFAFWGAEEGGPFGSRAYVEANGVEGLRAYLNLDMLGSPNPVRFVYAEAGAAPGSDALTDAFGAALDAAGMAWEPIDLEGDSDHGPFVEAGVPTGGLFSGGIEPVTEAQAAASGAEAGVPADPCSHRSCDTLDNVGFRVLDEMLDALAMVVADLGGGVP